MEIYRKWRPKKFSDVIGQKAAVRVLRGFCEADEVPHAIMLTGGSGTGKTTLARIVASKLGVEPLDFLEINAANARGVDTVRDAVEKARLRGMSGGRRLIYWDECFPAGSLVWTEIGQKRIERVRPGDAVRSMAGWDIVTDCFRNSVQLGRLVRLWFSDGRTMVTTADHLLFTESGWVPASKIRGLYIFGFSGYAMEYETYMRILPAAFLFRQQRSGMLLEKLRSATPQPKVGVWPQRGQKVPCMPGVLFGSQVERQGVLQPILCGERQVEASGVPCEVVFCGNESKDFRSPSRDDKALVSPKDAEVDVRSCFCSDDTQEGKGNQAQKRDSSCMEGRAGRKWEVDRASEDVGCRIGRSVEDGVGNRDSWSGEEAIPGSWEKVCSRSGFGGSSVGGGSGREGASVEEDYQARQEENQDTRIVRVDRVEVYQRGDPRGLFRDCVSDFDCSRGFVEFYDLEVKGHSSYFVNGLPVHNCHKLTSDAQTCLLKPLEDCPDHCWFVLATSDPAKVIRAIQTRCTIVKCDMLGPSDIEAVISRVLTGEKLAVSKAVIDRIVECSEGSARKALVDLEKVIRIDSEEDRLAAIFKSEDSRTADDLVSALLKPGTKWTEISVLIKGFEGEVEPLRRRILGAASSMLLNGNQRAAALLSAFRDHWYDAGKAGLVLACWEVYGSRK